MKKISRFSLYGLLLWGSIFCSGYLLMDIKSYDIAFFNALVFVATAIFTMFFVFILYRPKKTGFFKEGITAGLIWMVECLVFDMFLYHWGPDKMSFTLYFTDIGISYVSIPVIVAGMGYLLDRVGKRINAGL